VSRIRRLLRRRITVVALTALCALVLAVPASARTALEPGQSGPGSQGLSLSLADKSIPSDQHTPGVSFRLADTSSPSIAHRHVALGTLADSHNAASATAARRGATGNIRSADDSNVSVLAFVLSLTGAIALAGGAVSVVTVRSQRRYPTPA
jgi:hypothetical protein